jgi:hypothetical protein
MTSGGHLANAPGQSSVAICVRSLAQGVARGTRYRRAGTDEIALAPD